MKKTSVFILIILLAACGVRGTHTWELTDFQGKVTLRTGYCFATPGDRGMHVVCEDEKGNTDLEGLFQSVRIIK